MKWGDSPGTGTRPLDLTSPDPLQYIQFRGTPMKVYAVIGGWDYEGEDFNSLRLFDCFSTATAYCEEMGEQYDYALMETREVCMESALATA